ncbi:hypothetical protein JCGZ_06340 [Jatropha curcas]|uniref:Uncharacterized protein n=1 Tax=Jatropha curcas TaxID=180498 RepID=A0A067KRS2_JATCU|nr:hypothetical protein JCGZ_06340 [Jatropha curcas]
MYGPVVVVSRTGSSSGHWRCGPTSTVSIQAVRVVILRLTPGGSLGIWHTAIIPLPVLRIPITEEGMTAEDREEEYDALPLIAFCQLATMPHISLLDCRPGYQSIFLCDSLQERKKHRTTAYYRAEAEAAAPAGLAGAVLGDVPFPPGMEVVLDPALGLGSAIIIPADVRQAPPPLQLDPEHATHMMPAQRYQELCRRFGFARLYSERHERDLEIGRLRRHQSRQSSVVSRLQLEVDRLRTRLEVEGIPLDFFEEEDDGSSSDDAPPSPPPQAAAGPSRRRR